MSSPSARHAPAYQLAERATAHRRQARPAPAPRPGVWDPKPGRQPSDGDDRRQLSVIPSSARRARPPRKPSSSSTATCTSSAPSRSTRAAVAPTVPPVASTSSITSTRAPGQDRVGVHGQRLVAVLEGEASGCNSPGSLPGLRTGTKPAPSSQRHRGGEDEPARLHADHHVDAAGRAWPPAPRPLPGSPSATPAAG